MPRLAQLFSSYISVITKQFGLFRSTGIQHERRLLEWTQLLSWTDQKRDENKSTEIQQSEQFGNLVVQLQFDLPVQQHFEEIHVYYFCLAFGSLFQVWNTTLERKAYEMSLRCYFKHEESGENLYAGTSLSLE